MMLLRVGQSGNRGRLRPEPPERSLNDIIVSRDLAIVLVLVAALGCGHAPAPRPEAAPRTRVVFLGTGTPVSDPERAGPSVAVVVDGDSYVVDAGVGVVRRAAATGIEALRTRNLRRVFLTHLHSDHTLGYPDLLLSGAVLHRGVPLVAYGPHGLRAMSDHILAAWQKDIDVRTNGLERGDRAAYAVEVHEIEPGVVYRDAKVTVRAFAVRHGSWDEAFGYRFDTPDRSIVFSGDTAPTDAIARACDGCDLLVHEVYARACFAKLPEDDRKYHSAFHTSGPELGRIATAARARKLVLHHQLFFGCSEDELLGEVKAAFTGEVVSSHDLDVM